jgi:hypothetical protein
MPKKRHSPEEIVDKLRQVDVMTSQGSHAWARRSAPSGAEATYHRWRNEFRRAQARPGSTSEGA